MKYIISIFVFLFLILAGYLIYSGRAVSLINKVRPSNQVEPVSETKIIEKAIPTQAPIDDSDVSLDSDLTALDRDILDLINSEASFSEQANNL